MCFVMPIVLGIVAMLFYLAFYVNDRTVLEEAVKESAIYAAANYPYDKDKAVKCVIEKAAEISDNKIFSAENLRFDANVKNGYVVVNGSCDFVIPMFSQIANHLFNGNFRLEAEGRGAITNPVSKIWLIEIANTLKGEEDK